MTLLTRKLPTLTYFILPHPHLFLTLPNATVYIIWLIAGVRHTEHSVYWDLVPSSACTQKDCL